jgi:hypothetical protein
MSDVDHIDLKVKYGDWVAIKRMTIDKTTTPQKIAFQLAGIRSTAEAKTYKIMGIKTESLDEFSEKLTKGNKKKIEFLSEAIAALGKPEAKSAISSASPNKALEPMAVSYLMNRIAQNLGYSTSIGQKAMSKIYKELKPPRVPGLKGMAKKA